MTTKLQRQDVVASRDQLPVFPRVISEILATVDDPGAKVSSLEALVARDPVLLARVLHLANAAATRSRRDGEVYDLHTAIALIGLARLREETLRSKLGGFLDGLLPSGVLPGLWQHSAATGVCAEQLAAHLAMPTVPALVAGVLHDIGEFWLCRFHQRDFLAAWEEAQSAAISVDAAERERFGVDHATVGAWLADSWGLPMPICVAIRYHHRPESALSVPLVPLVHIADVLGNTLDPGRARTRAGSLSPNACAALGLQWEESAELLYARIESAGGSSPGFYDLGAPPPPQVD